MLNRKAELGKPKASKGAATGRPPEQDIPLKVDKNLDLCGVGVCGLDRRNTTRQEHARSKHAPFAAT